MYLCNFAFRTFIPRIIIFFYYFFFFRFFFGFQPIILPEDLLRGGEQCIITFTSRITEISWEAEQLSHFRVWVRARYFTLQALSLPVHALRWVYRVKSFSEQGSRRWQSLHVHFPYSNKGSMGRGGRISDISGSISLFHGLTSRHNTLSGRARGWGTRCMMSLYHGEANLARLWGSYLAR